MIFFLSWKAVFFFPPTVTPKIYFNLAEVTGSQAGLQLNPSAAEEILFSSQMLF